MPLRRDTELELVHARAQFESPGAQNWQAAAVSGAFQAVSVPGVPRRLTRCLQMSTPTDPRPRLAKRSRVMTRTRPATSLNRHSASHLHPALAAIDRQITCPEQFLQHRLRQPCKRPTVLESGVQDMIKSVAAFSKEVVVATYDSTGEVRVHNRGKWSQSLDVSSPKFKVMVPETNHSQQFVAFGKDAVEFWDCNRLVKTSAVGYPGPFDRMSTIIDGDTSLDGMYTSIIRLSDSYMSIYIIDKRAPDASLSLRVVNTGHIDFRVSFVRMLGGNHQKILCVWGGVEAHQFDLRTLRYNAVRTISVVGSVEPPTWCPKLSSMKPAFSRHTELVTSLCTLGDEDSFVTGSADEGCRLWSLESERCVENFNAASTCVEPFAPRNFNSKSFYSGSINDDIAEWSVNDPVDPLHVFRPPRFWPKGLSGTISGGQAPDSIIAGTVGGKIYVWD